ncbi:MAG: class IV adenylate cyclase [Sulfolobales archaeon]
MLSNAFRQLTLNLKTLSYLGVAVVGSAEFEVKVRVSDIDLERVFSKLTLLGFTKEGEVLEEDHYFDLRGCPGYRQGTVLRFRKVSTGSTVEYRLTYKGVIAYEGIKARDELEVSLPDDRVFEVLKLVGFRDLVVRKKRTYFNRAGFKVSIDEVECLGRFLEFEEVNPPSVESFLAKVRDVLNSLGIPSNKLITESYLELYLRQGCYT